MRLFDKTQIIISICGVASSILTLIFLVVCLLTATPVYDENNVLVKIVYLDVPQAFLSIFFFLSAASTVWFIARLVTYKMRKKEATKVVD